MIDIELINIENEETVASIRLPAVPCADDRIWVGPPDVVPDEQEGWTVLDEPVEWSFYEHKGDTFVFVSIMVSAIEDCEDEE